MRRPKTRTVLGAGIPILVVVLLLAAWAIDTGSSGGRVARNVRLEGRSVGRLAEDRLVAVVGKVAKAYAATPVEIRTTGHTYRSTAGAVGLNVDEARTVEAALDVGRTEAVPLRPLSWIASFASPRTAPLRFRVRWDVLEPTLVALDGPEGRQPSEPAIVGTPSTVGIKGGVSGFALDPADVGRKLLAAAAGDRHPLSISTEPVEQKPQVSDDQASALAADLATKTAAPLRVTVRGGPAPVAADIPVATVRGWLRSRLAKGDGGLEATVDGPRVMKDLQAAFTDVVARAEDARFDVVGASVKITPSRDGFTCCRADTPATVRDAVLAGRRDVSVALEVQRPSFTTEAAQKLGIKEPVGTTTDWMGQPQVRSFTTYYEPGQSRVINIHRIADLVRGAIVAPGKTFSLNGYVGPRTAEKGFVEAPVIAEGLHDTDIGGGVSQFATTLFNAAFFAGLDFGEYQSHSLPFDRYPRGREATMGFPHPDLEIENTTPYGILIWTSYTDTSLTVTLFSTQWVFGEQTGQSESKAGNCTRVATQRTRRYADGRTATDQVYATYRPAEGVDC